MKNPRPSLLTSILLGASLGWAGLAPMTSASAQAAEAPAQLQLQLQQSVLSLSQAIDAAQAAFPGRVIDAQFDFDNGLPYYEVQIITPQDSHLEVLVNASSGVAILHKTKGPASAQDKQRLDASKVTLQQALHAALQHTQGKAVEAELDREWGSTVIKVHVLTTGLQRVEITLDAETGKVLGSKVD